MDIYWCFDKWDCYGVFVVAKSRGRAKDLARCELDIEYTDVRTAIYKKGVEEKKEGIIDLGSPLLKKYGLKYTELEEAEK